MKRLRFFIMTFILLSSYGCNTDKCEYSLDDICFDWKVANKTDDNDMFNSLLEEGNYLRFYKDGNYIVYDSIASKGNSYFTSFRNEEFELKNDSFKIQVKGLQWAIFRIVKLTSDKLILQYPYENEEVVSNAVFTKVSSLKKYEHFDILPNKIDTLSSIQIKKIHTRDNKIFEYWSIDRTYLYNTDTIYHAEIDRPLYENKDSLINRIDRIFNDCFYMGEYGSYLGHYGSQKSVDGFDYDTIVYAFDNYITYHNEWDLCRIKGSNSRNMADFIYTTHNADSNRLEYADIFKDGVKSHIDPLVAIAFYEQRKASGWLESYSGITENLISWKNHFVKMNIPYENVSIGENGIIFSFYPHNEYIEICSAESTVHATVPYHELRAYLKPPFSFLTK